MFLAKPGSEFKVPWNSMVLYVQSQKGLSGISFCLSTIVLTNTNLEEAGELTLYT